MHLPLQLFFNTKIIAIMLIIAYNSKNNLSLGYLLGGTIDGF